ncbi:sigma-54 dependent transcriptional regulator [Marivirga sp.]|uniref:sigma-54-dependent transcriptional regulator n=1 Tax=Marivirga sp. TaxID=2018662 RepID=UPI002D802BFA|nr:sigma-54 dependent transcriptional regulator [Marivirga sp.]HET8858323.1 sigma-54 dependent transcriptional regulator [Marivirga sp.]
MKESKKLLIVDDDPSFNEMLSNYLSRNKYQVESAHSGHSALELLKKHNFDLVLTDFRLPKMNGLALIERIKKNQPQTPVILITNYADIRTAVQSIKLGAFEFVNKPVNPDELLKTIEKALDFNAKPKNTGSDPDQPLSQNNQYIIGNNPLSLELWKQVNIVAPTKMSILIMGESGTGKEYVAKKIHELSKRSDKPFVAIDCGVLSKELAASEFFGHEKGAFTGALTDRKGQFELANGGTLFLDEIGNLPYEVQSQLLRALQEKVIRKVGGGKELEIDVRIISATNERLSENIQQEAFRNDLYHRLNEFEIYSPSLKERIDDLEEFINFFLKEANKELGKEVNELSEEVLRIFTEYEWPGNLRELKNIIKRAVLLSDTSRIEVSNLPVGFNQKTELKSEDSVEAKPLKSTGLDLKEMQENQEKNAIKQALIQHKFNKSKAAQSLNIDRTTLYKKIKSYNIDS